MGLKVIQTAVLLGFAAAAFWRGYHERRPYWKRGSWIRFGLTIAVGLALIGAMFVFSSGLERHAAWTGARGSNLRGAWAIAIIGSMTAGVLITTISLAWFADGHPMKPFRPWRLLTRVPVQLSSARRKVLPPEYGEDAWEAPPSLMVAARSRDHLAPPPPDKIVEKNR